MDMLLLAESVIGVVCQVVTSTPKETPMPNAVVNVGNTEKKELKTCPEGYVELRRLSYGQKLERQSMAMQTSMREQKGGKAEMDMKMMQQEVSAFEFRHCIAEHNLEDEKGQKLDFRNKANVFRLDPRIGEEIATYIDKMNNFEEGEEAENSDSGSDQP
jgi:selenocysteine-specific translation elongation factor